MTQSPNNNESLIHSLKQSIRQCIEQTDDQSTLTRCLEMLQAAHKRQEEGDEIVRDMAVTGQLRGASSDKRQLLDYTLSTQQEELSAGTLANVETSEEETPEKLLQQRLLNRRMLLGVLTAVAVCAIIVFAGHYIHWSDDSDKQKYVTVAEKYETIEVNGVQFNMVSIEGGTFTMGATNEDGEEDSDELPTQKVTLSPFTIGETEVTQGLWKAVMGNLPASFDGDYHPMKDISWDDCQEFIDSLNKLTGRHFHLPTEAQWEYAARGGNRSKGYKYAGGSHIEEVAWFSANAWDKGKDSPDFGNHSVGTRKPNELGLYDMSGNVWEWCQDSYARYDGTPKKDPTGPQNSSNSYRVNRGGSWDYIATSARCSNRRNRTPDFRNFNLGMRLAE